MKRLNNFKLKLNLLVIVFCLLPNIEGMAQEDTLSLMHITDLHVIFNQDVYHPDMMINRQAKQYHLGEARLRYFMQNIPERTKSDLVVATGDLVDFFEAVTSSGDMIEMQVIQFSRLLNDYNIPVLLTLGNHDAFTYHWGEDKLLPNQDFVGRARAEWIRNVSCFKDGTYYSKIYQVGDTRFRLIFLDDLFFRFRPEEQIKAYIDKPELYWLKAQFNALKDDIEIIFMHIPLPENVTEPESQNELYSELKKHSSCKLIISGHLHRNEINTFPSAEGNEIIQVETGSLAQNPESWRQIRLTENNILVSSPGKTSIELVIPVK